MLAGGRSTRMQRDKATLTYHGRTQLDRAMELLEPLRRTGLRVGARRISATIPLRARFAQIVDAHEGLGPIAGIVAAPGASIRTRPGWCSPATCPSSMRRRSST